jgi:glycosyltransferase involved in cell wall biosynthesis
MNIAFCHHLSLKYLGGGEKWVINIAKELQKRGHEVQVYALPFTMNGPVNLDQPKLLGDIPYHEGHFFKVKADVTYVTYHPLSGASFYINGPKIAGIHAQTYQVGFNRKYGLLPTLAKLIHKLIGNKELKKFNAVHVLSPQHVQNKYVYCIPNFVDSTLYHPFPKEEIFTVAYASRKVWQKGYDIWQSIKSELPHDMSYVESGNIPEMCMPQFFGSNHAVVAPSRVDTFGLTLVEAEMCGTPILTSNIPIHKQLELPLILCNSIKDYVDYLVQLSDQWYHRRVDYEFFTGKLRQATLKFDKKNVVSQLEDMFLEVANYTCT